MANGSWWRIFAIAELDRAHREMKQAAGEPVDSIEAANTWPPAGFWNAEAAAGLYGVNAETVRYWAK